MKKTIAALLTLIILLTFISGCSSSPTPNPENPVTLNMWHVYGSQTKSPLNDVIEEFNKSVGKEKGITINVVSVTSSSEIDKALSASANNEPGAEDMPDLFTAYPRVAEIVGQDKLLRWDNYFTENELNSFKQDFLTEGYFNNELLMLPIAKSTEAFYLNETLYNRFCSETGVSVDDLITFNAVFDTAIKYYDWSDGQSFLQVNDYYNYSYIGMKSNGCEFIKNGRLQTNEKAFETIWKPLAKAAIYGAICLEDGYAAARWKTAEVIANTGSTADVLYQPTEVVYPDNTTEPIVATALPYPVFNENTNNVIYRGGGLFAINNKDERKNQAAYIFAKWLIHKENNLDFVTQAGYLPVTNDAFDMLLSDINIVKTEKYHSVYETVSKMMQNYTFYALPLYSNSSDIQLDFETNVKSVLKSARNQYTKRTTSGENPDEVLDELITTSLLEIRKLSGN